MREFEPKGLGGAPIRATTLPEDAEARKRYPVVSGVLDYFPDAIVAVAEVSHHGNEQHNPGQPLHWDRAKSGDEADTLARHLLQRGTKDTDGLRHSAKAAWRALALLQKEIEGAEGEVIPDFKVNVEPTRKLLAGDFNQIWCFDTWKDTPQGHDYWRAIEKGGFYPEKRGKSFPRGSKASGVPR